MEPVINVGILFAPEVKFRLNGKFILTDSRRIFEGEAFVKLLDDKPLLSVEGKGIPAEWPLRFDPLDYDTASFDLLDVTIGINFHWERKQDQRFRGSLEIIREAGHLTAINSIDLEDYLTSVISSEMSATSSPELLKSHAVVSRSWLLAQMEKSRKLKHTGSYQTSVETSQERIRWYDREDHQHFDVCADDHCQRYQGISHVTSLAVEEAIAVTRGLVLSYGDDICDARYSKSCGGISECFENVWEPVHHPYLEKVIDNPEPPEGYDTNLTREPAARRWILGQPPAFCNTRDKEILSQVLKDYDQETVDFYRWETSLSQQRLQELLCDRVNVDVGEVLDLVPVERGISGRLIKMEIRGTRGNFVIGKELEIRKALSPSHLYSSAIVIEKGRDRNGIPQSFTLKGAGWGHGVGFCQIGAAVMGAGGYSYQAILAHYFTGAELKKLY
ncbi:MAG: SpoIID/LytB domain-containing protein [Bacteroidales bacterium]|jgi:SpoIID/LytB domain protein|nr:SpoIID/LytB domain-containing protein [Bacteroidales bacterium]NLM92276.1 SpoIID/LytB domain-containing protein [Bacteroidales bacterium]